MPYEAPEQKFGRRPQIKIDQTHDFTGGLNLRGDQLNLKRNESPDLMDVDLDRRGGFRLRNGARPWINVAAPRDIDSLVDFRTSAGLVQLLACGNGAVYHFNGTTWDTVDDTFDSSGITTGAMMRDHIYLSHPSDSDIGAKRWDGSTVEDIPDVEASAGSFNDDLDSPTDPSATTGSIPHGRHKVAHHNVMWATHDSDVRLRWSHPLFPEDWRTNDWIDIDRNQGPITALVPFGDRLLVFFERALYAVHGFPPSGFSVQNITKRVGAVGPHAVAATEAAIYFWDMAKGLVTFDGRELEDTFTKLSPAFHDATIDVPRSDEVAIGWHNRRVFCRVPIRPSGHHTFVLDTDTKGWTRHSRTPVQFLEFRSSDGEIRMLGPVDDHVWEWNVPNLHKDEEPDGEGGTVDVPIEAYYTTAWFGGSDLAVKKRWLRPVIAVRGGGGIRYRVGVLRDYDTTRTHKEFFMETTPTGGEGEGVWDTSLWGEALWASDSADDPIEVHRGSPLGNARAVALKFYAPTSA